MFGYISPLKSELRVREFEQFKACYCGLCHSLAKDFGLPARFILNYDFLFLAMLLWPSDLPPEYEKCRCPAKPLKKRPCCRCIPALGDAGAYSLILTWWKLRDTISDDGFLRTSAARLASAALLPSYRRAVDTAPCFNDSTRLHLSELSALEKAKTPSIDRTAHEFAELLSAAVPQNIPEKSARPLKEILYHTGRWIYIIDAVNDLAQDNKAGSYNPVAERFGIDTDTLPNDVKESLRITLENSLSCIRNAYGLMPENAWSEIIKNIIYLGMPAVTEAVFDGTFRRRKSQLPK